MAHVERIMYVELKTGFSDNGPAWVGKVRFSKTGRTAYYRGRNLQRHNGVYGNYIDVETGEEYWISGVKRDRTDRHWAGGGPVEIDSDVRGDYLKLVKANVAGRPPRIG
jgi:hypothetical protein